MGQESWIEGPVSQPLAIIISIMAMVIVMGIVQRSSRAVVGLVEKL